MDLDENNRIKTDNLYNICLTSADKKQSDDIGNPQMLNRTMNENCLRRWGRERGTLTENRQKCNHLFASSNNFQYFCTMTCET